MIRMKRNKTHVIIRTQNNSPMFPGNSDRVKFPTGVRFSGPNLFPVQALIFQNLIPSHEGQLSEGVQNRISIILSLLKEGSQKGRIVEIQKNRPILSGWPHSISPNLSLQGGASPPISTPYQSCFLQVPDGAGVHRRG